MGADDRLGTWEDDAVDRLVGPVPRAAPIEVQCAILRSALRQERQLVRLSEAIVALAQAIEGMATAPAGPKPATVRPPPVPAKG